MKFRLPISDFRINAQAFLPARRRNARRAFSFTEILFAVMILGIGFIMVAAMFPVALQQTENSTSDTIAANVARSGVNFVNPLGQMTFVSAQEPTTFPDQNLCVLTPTVRVTAGAKNAWRLWVESFNTTPKDAAFVGSFPTLGIPFSGSPLPSSQVIPGEVWALDVNWARDNPSLARIDDQVRSINGVAVPSTPYLFSDVVWKTVAQSMIQTGNARYAWVAFYKRDMYESVSAGVGGAPPVYSFSYAPFAQVIVVALQCRNADSFTTVPSNDNDLTPVTGSLEPARYTGCQLVAPNGNVPTSSPANTTIVGGIVLPVPQGDAKDRSAPGTFAIIANDNLDTNNPYHGQLNGHVFRLGNRFPGTSNNSWEFVPGFTLTAGDATTLRNMGNASFTIYMLGMGRDPNSNATPKLFAGPAMDVAVYSSFIPCATN